MAHKIDGGLSPASSYDSDSSSVDNSVATVQSGEITLPEVAQRLGITSESLLQANSQISDPSKLVVGQQLRLPRTQPVLEGAAGGEDASASQVRLTVHPLAFGDPIVKTVTQLKLAEQATASITTSAVSHGETKDQDATALLSQFRNVSGQLKHLLHSHPIRWDLVRSAFSEVRDLERRLGKLGISMAVDPASLPSPDADDGDQDVDRSVNGVRQDVQNLYNEFAKLDAGFMQQPAADPQTQDPK